MTVGAIRAGQAFIELFLDSTKFVSGINTLQSRLKRIGTSVATAGAKLTALGGATVAAFVPAIKAASDFEESLNVFGAVFGKNTGEMRKWAAETANAIGRSEAQLVSFVAKSKNQLLNFGFDDSQATEMSKALSTLAVDLASFYNTADDDAMTALAAAFRGEADPIERFGVNVNAAAVNMRLLNQNIDPEAATLAQKAYARYTIILEQTARAQGDSVKTAGSFANQMKRLQAAAENIGVAIGSTLLPILTKVSSALLNVSGSVVKWVQENPQLAKTIFLVAAGVTALGAGLVVVGGIIAAASVALSALTAPFALIAGAIGLVVPALMALLSPIGLVTAALVGVAAAVWAGMGGIGPVIDYLSNAFTWLKDRASEAFGAIAKALTRGDISAAAGVLWASLKVAWRAGISALQSYWINFKTFVLRVFTEVAFSLAEVWIRGTAGIETAWINMTGRLKKYWASVVASSQDLWTRFTIFVGKDAIQARANAGEITQAEADAQIKLLEIGGQAARDEVANNLVKRLTEADQKQKEGVARSRQKRDSELAGLEKARNEAQDALSADQDAALAAAKGELAKAKSEYDKALAVANGGEAGDPAAPNAPGTPPKPLADFDPNNVARISRALTSGPLLGGERAGQVFGGANEQVALSRLQLAEMKKMREEQERTRKQLARDMDDPFS